MSHPIFPLYHRHFFVEQRIVKHLFNDTEFRNEHSLAAVNSINWARILAQTVYYVYAYLQVTTTPLPGAKPQKVSFSVPTGNFGDILAGWYAKQASLAQVSHTQVSHTQVSHTSPPQVSHSPILPHMHPPFLAQKVAQSPLFSSKSGATSTF